MWQLNYVHYISIHYNDTVMPPCDPCNKKNANYLCNVNGSKAMHLNKIKFERSQIQYQHWASLEFAFPNKNWTRTVLQRNFQLIVIQTSQSDVWIKNGIRFNAVWYKSFDSSMCIPFNYRLPERRTSAFLYWFLLI